MLGITNGQTTTFAMDLNTGLTQVLNDGTNTYIYGNGRIAQTQGSTTEYFLGDALGSVRQLTNNSGAITYASAYDPYGVMTQSYGDSQTVYRFTGEYTDSYINLLWYGSRHYDPYLNQFTQPDTIVPNPYNSQDWNRYGYARYNPLRYTDPTGHIPCNEAGNGTCTPYTHSDQINDLKLIIKHQFRWNIKGNDWTMKELETIYETGNDILNYANEVTGGNGLDWMHSAFGNTTIEHVNFSDGHSDAWPTIYGPRIRLNENWLTNAWGAKVVFAHELGHVWDINSGLTNSGKMNRDLGGSSWCFFCAPGDGVPQWDPLYHRHNGDAYGNSARNEYFAEAFSATVYNPGHVPIPAGASEWVRLQMLVDVTRYLFPGGLQ